MNTSIATWPIPAGTPVIITHAGNGTKQPATIVECKDVETYDGIGTAGTHIERRVTVKLDDGGRIATTGPRYIEVVTPDPRDVAESDRLFARWQDAERIHCERPDHYTEASELRCLRAFVAHADANGLSKRGF